MKRIPHPLGDPTRRRLARQRKRLFDYRASMDWCCEECGAAHGTLTLVGANTYHRVEIVIAHRNGSQADWRWSNLYALCRDCRRRYVAPVNAMEAGQARERYP